MNRKIFVDVSHVDPVVAVGLSGALHLQADFCVTEHSPDEPRRTETAHVVVTDYDAGLELVRGLHQRSAGSGPLPAVLVVTQRQKEWEIRRALQAGVRGYLLIGCAIDELNTAVRSLSTGVRHIGAVAARRLADSVAREAMTSREEEVLRLLVEGLGNKVIAREMGIGVGTVKSHLRSIYGKLDATSRTEAVTVAERRGLLDRAAQPAPATQAIGRVIRPLATVPRHLPGTGTSSRVFAGWAAAGS